MNKDTLKAWIGIGILVTAAVYGLGVTVLLILFGSKATGDALMTDGLKLAAASPRTALILTFKEAP